MKRKIAFWIVMILVNVGLGVVSVKAYRNMEARIVGVENYQKSWDEYQSHYDTKLFQLKSDHEKTVTQLLRALGVDGKYDFNNNLIRQWDLNEFFNYKVYVRTSVILEVPEKLRELISESAQSFVKVSEAPAMIIGRHVLMASHVSDAELFSRQTIGLMTPEGALGVTVNFKVLKYTVMLLAADKEYSLKELYRNKEKDFALFEMPALPGIPAAPNFPFEIGKSNELKIGHFLYLNGQPGIHSEVARPGFVTSLVSASLGGAPEVNKDDNKFGLSQSVDQGDSGSSIIAFRDGRPELVGIILEYAYKTDRDNSRNIRASALKINVAVDEIKAKLGIDLRELQRQILYK